MKYIDADKLIAEINERLMSVNLEKLGNFGFHRAWAYNDVKDIINSLQQEQPKSTCKNCGFYENNCPYIRGKLVPYPNNVCKDYIYSAMKEQEQPEVDLEKEYSEFVEQDSVYSRLVNGIVGKAIARHFYELGRNTRKEESK